jgi:predicted CoA-binding protein
MQIGAIDAAAKARAQPGVAMDRCVKIEYAPV